MRTLSTTAIGALCALGASVAFTINDMAIKSLSGGYALHEVVLLRSVIGLAIVLAVVMPLSGGFRQIRTRHPVKHLFRGLFVVGSNMAFYAALSVMPIADATAIFFVSPLMIALFSVIFLHEKVGPHRWGAIAAGLIGAIIMVRPGTEAFTVVALLPLLAAAGYAGLQVMTRGMGLSESAVTMGFYTQMTFLTFSAGFGLLVGDGRFDPGGDSAASFLLREWIWPQAADWPFFLLAGFGTAVGGLLIAQAYRICEAALVAPLEYSAMPMAILWGVVIFGEWPDFVAWSGIALILGAGIYMIYRETRAARK